MNLDMSNQTNPGLLRFRSAPSSSFSNFSTNGVEKGGSSKSTDVLTSRYLGSSGDGDGGNLVGQSFQDLIEDKGIIGNGYSQLPPYYPRQSCSNSAAIDTSFRVVSSSVGMDSYSQPKMGSSLLRQSSSPAGLFSHLTPLTGYTAIRGVRSYRVGNDGNGELSPTPGRLNRQMSFSSGVPSSLGMLSRISEIEADTVGGNGTSDARFYGSDYPFGSWNESSHFTENFSGLKREVQDDDKLFLGAQNSNGELLNRPPMLSHHLSLPKTSGEMAVMEKVLHFQDSVQCKIRAKRGCATHPRSIAERVRRTRISERMRKLQVLVPNMDKQTNTADMLDLAVDYIKDLQKQYKMLSDSRANCRCSSMQKLVQI